MKKINLIKRLWTDSHEKQSPQRAIRYAVMLMMLLTLGVGQMWAATSTTLYFCPGICGKNWTTPYVNVCTMWNSASDNHWSNLAMSEVSGKTVDGYKVYSVTFTDEYNGARTIEFHASQNNYTGSLKPVNASWTSVATYNGKLCNAAGNGWMTYETDHTIASGATVVWDLAEDNWGSNAYLYRAHYVADADHDAMTKLANNQFYKTYNANTKCKLFLFRNANGSTWADYKQTTDITGSNCDLSNNITLFTYPNTVSGKKLDWQKTTNAKKATSGTKIYFDNTDAWDGEIWLKYGTQWYNRSSAARATLVTGTANLYVITIPNDCYYEKYYLASSYGWTGYNPIEDTHVGNRIEYKAAHLSSDITYVATGSTSGSSPTVYATTSFSGHTRRLTFGSHTNGQITVRYTDESGVERTVSSASADYVDVAQTCNVVITAVPNTGYAPSGLTLGGDAITSGATQTIRADGTIVATFVAETTYNITVSYKYGSRTLHDAAVYSVGVTTPSNISSETIDGFEFDAWSDLTNVKNNTGDLVTDPININSTTAAGSMTCNYTPWDCSLDVVPSSGSTSYSSRTAMSYDATTKAYYKNFTTTAATQYFRFYINSIEYAPSSNTEMVIAGTKVAAATDVTDYASNKPSVYFNDGGTGSNITVWFDYENKKAWVTEQKHTVTISAGANGSVSPTSVSVGNVEASSTIHAIPAAGYAFVGWTNVDADHHITDFTATWNSTNEGWDLEVKADDETTIVANFAPRFALVGAISAAGDPDGGMPTPTWDANSAAAFTYSAGTYTLTRGLTSPNTTYAFQIIDRRAESWIWRGYSDASNNLPVDNTTTYTLNGGNNVYFDTRAAGDYTFTVVEETITGVKYPKVKIACPTSYLITSGQKTFYNEDASSDATETGGTFTAVDNASNNVKGANKYVAANASVTFTATPKDGYTFAGWYEDASCETEYDDDDSDVSISGDDGEVLELSSITAAKTVYAKFAEKMTTVTLYSIGSGHIEISSSTVTSAKVGKHTTYSVVAVPDDGHYFTGWTKSSGTDYTVSSLSTATTTLSGNGGGSTSGQMLTANFARRWVIAGEWEKDGSGNWVLTNDMNVSTVGGKTCAGRQITGLAANTSYNFKLYDRTDANGGGHWVGYASSGQVYDYETHDAVSPADSILVNSYPGNNISLKTAAQGDYYFYYNIYSHKLYVSFPASRKVEMGIYTQSDGVSSAYVGGTISAVDERDNVITNGLYIKSGDDITFTASPKAGYIWRGWYDNAYGYGDPVATERVHTDENITSVAFRRYAFFEEALYTVKVNRNDVIETSYKVGIDTHPTIMAATAPTGKIFDRWVTTGSATVEDPYASTTKITGATDDASTVTATFKDLPKIYIDMTSATGWNPSNMYVVFYKNNGYFDGTNGTGLSSTYVITPTPLEMTRMGTSKIWYYSYDPTSGVFEGETITCVAFVDHTFAANTGNFSSATVTYRTDFSSCMNMFVVTDNSGTNKNTTCYYRNTNAIDGTKGYWRKYEENNSGFYVNNLPGGSVEFTNEDGGNTYSARVNLDANTTYHFYLGCCNGWNWSNDKTKLAFNSDNRTRMVQPYDNVSSDDYRCQLTTTAAGYYTFTITPQNTREVQLSIDFPVAANDYRAVYNNAASSPTVSRPSNIIKNDQNSGTISLWLNKGTNYISFQKATLGAGGAVSWTACGSQQTVTGVAEAGIYTMTLTRDGSTYTVSTPEKYEGDLYIRTDCAPGKWADYTENKLEENAFNFKADDASTFDYYYCKWVNDAGTNVKCVIANEINVALSDTLKGESILVSVGQPSNETLPEGANVRFSYNSVTNTLKRSYLTGSATDVFLNIIPDNEEEVYQTDGTTDMYGSAAAKNKFSDLGNWVYVLNAKVKPGATAAVKANYNSTSQELIAEETTLLGGTEDVLYEIRLIYDFKTNYLMSAWMPSGNVDEAISLNSDIMIVRRGQNDANQLSFSDDGELTDVKRAYGVFEFRKTDMVTHMGSWNDYGYTYGLCMYYFSLPFDVNVSDIFGVGTMGDDWRIQFYNGKKRAEKGWFAGDGTTTFWEDVPADTVLYAYEGYLLMLNRSHFNNGSHKVWNNVTTSAYLYFPSTEPVYALDSIEKPITVPSHECTIDRFFTQDSLEYYDSETKQWKTGARNHKYVDSHWNMMGTPLFRNKAAKSIEACKVKIGEADSTLNYVYEWVPSTNSLSARQVLNTSFTFKPMFAYMVQYAGKVTFEGAAIKPAEIAARRSSEHKQYTVELELTKENQFAGRTYIELRENAVDSFMLNEDMYIMKGSKVADIYTHADGYELAANVLTINSHIVPVSVDTKSAGTYTFSMPSNFSGTVILIDKYANTRVNLAYEDYEVYLEQGAIKDRFEVEININDAPTTIDGAADGEGTLKDGKAHKFIMNDMMYILKDGVLYDARGNRVK